ncbi:MAG: tetratricopeptide repeat protein [Chloracidobacterium sp.]|nr:tetratricopeptide repeat protein [Chloracidobacterium sp.]
MMPFVNESGNEDVEYLSDGMTETLIGSLSKLPNLIVKPSSSVFRYKGTKTDAKSIGQELNVDSVLNGRIVQRGEELTLSLELVDVQKDAVLWSERYVRKQSDLVSLQSEIAKDVSSRLKTTITGAEEEKIAKSYTADAEAYRDYLQGRYYWNKRDGVNLRKAIEQFEAAIDKDPKYALAYVGLADSYAVFPWWDDDFPADSLSKARQFAKRAIEIDDSLGEAHASLAYVNLYSWNWAEAEKEFLRAIELSPDYANAQRWYHEYLITQGRVDEATLTLKKAYELEPLSVIINYNLATHYCRDKLDPESAIEFAKRVVDLDPNFPGGPNLMVCVYLQQGRNADALAEAKKAVELTNGKIRRFVANLGVAYAINGQTENAKAIIKDLEEAYAKENSVGIQIAEVYAALGNKDKAFEWIEKDVDNRGFELVLQFRRVATFGSLKSDERYAAILKRMGLSE